MSTDGLTPHFTAGDRVRVKETHPAHRLDEVATVNVTDGVEWATLTFPSGAWCTAHLDELEHDGPDAVDVELANLLRIAADSGLVVLPDLEVEQIAFNTSTGDLVRVPAAARSVIA